MNDTLNMFNYSLCLREAAFSAHFCVVIYSVFTAILCVILRESVTVLLIKLMPVLLYVTVCVYIKHAS